MSTPLNDHLLMLIDVYADAQHEYKLHTHSGGVTRSFLYTLASDVDQARNELREFITQLELDAP